MTHRITLQHFTTLLGLIKKMVQYVQADVLANLCAEPIEPNLGTLLVEVCASVLDNEVSPILYNVSIIVGD